jgi:hypothetical protein
VHQTVFPFHDVRDRFETRQCKAANLAVFLGTRRRNAEDLLVFLFRVLRRRPRPDVVHQAHQFVVREPAMHLERAFELGSNSFLAIETGVLRIRNLCVLSTVGGNDPRRTRPSVGSGESKMSTYHVSGRV